MAVAVDLGAGTASGGDAGSDVLVEVEHLEGSAHADVLTGDGGANRLLGAGGNDTLDGGAGADWLEGGAGADALTGGAGEDTVSYAGSAAVTVSLSSGLAQGGDADGDTFSGVEHLEGSAHADDLGGDNSDNRLYGLGGDDRLIGLGGNDVLVGGAGADELIGGPDEDTASYAGSPAAVMVNLLAGTALGGDAEGDTFSGVEHLEGSAYGDTLTGGRGANRLFGLGGNDELRGEGGSDVLEGGAGADVLDGGAGIDRVSYAGSPAAVMVDLLTGTVSGGDAQGDTIIGFEQAEGSAHGDVLAGDNGSYRLYGLGGDDQLLGRGGNDVLEGGAGADRLEGGSGRDTANYESSVEAVTVNLATGTALGGDAEGDVFVEIENLQGSAHGDTLTGDGGVNWLFGLGGDDVLEGGAGADEFYGGADEDTVSYAGSAAAVMVNLGADVGLSGDAEGDTFTAIENVQGSAHGDVLTGDGGPNRLFGAGGNDTLEGGAGADVLEGGPGEDTVSYAGSVAAVTVSLATGTGAGSDAEGDEITDVENLEGSAHGDVLTGDSGINRLFGLGGNDVLEGGAGADVLEGGLDEDTASYAGSAAAVMVDLATGTVSGGDAEGDTLSGFENLEGSAHGDTLTGDGDANRLSGSGGDDMLEGGAGADVLEGGAGADVLNGGAGADTVSYAGSAVAVMVNLGTGTVSGGDAQGDTLSGFENAEGSAHGDTLTGDDKANRLLGLGGDDELRGEDGADVLEGGAGADQLEGGRDFDMVSYAGSNAAVTVNLGSGTVSGGDAQGDTISGFEFVEGSAHGDVLTGDDGFFNRLFGLGGDDELLGEGGSDLLVGGAGADVLNGGSGIDEVSYAGSDAAVTVNLGTGTASGGDAQGDTFSEVEHLTGSAYGDVLTGDDGNNWLTGDQGDDVLSGGAGDDRFIFDRNNGDDRITDFTDGEDRIDLGDFSLSGFGALTLSSEADGVMIDLTAHGGGTILLEDADMADLDAADFSFF